MPLSLQMQMLTFFGFLHPVKGLETLIAAFKQVLATKPQARLLLIDSVESLALVGEQATHYWQKLHTVVADLELSTAVHFTGYVAAETASRYLSGTDIGVLPFNHGVTLKSGSLLALLAHGLPVIATQHNPPDRELDDCLCLIAPRDVDGLALALIDLLTGCPKRKQLSDTGRTVAQTLTWDAMADMHLQLYQSVWLNFSAAN